MNNGVRLIVVAPLLAMISFYGYSAPQHLELIANNLNGIQLPFQSDFGTWWLLAIGLIGLVVARKRAA